MVCTANRTTVFRLLAESYAFWPRKQLLPVYDYESEVVAAMANSARRRGTEVTFANFAWPSMRIHGTDPLLITIGNRLWLIREGVLPPVVVLLGS